MKASTVSLLMTLTACGEIEPCDPGQELNLGSCVVASGGSGGMPPATAGTNAEAGQGGEPSGECSPAVPFGEACGADTDCGCVTNYCAKAPGQTQGNCTRTGCLDDPTLCPEGFQCLDLSVFDPTLPDICMPPM
ncbi:MAG TPA: hypothetical protein VIM73_08130 [Polyangiaceae bacterium]